MPAVPGHGRCVLIAPDYFDVDGTGVGRVLLEKVARPTSRPARGADCCPEGAIRLMGTDRPWRIRPPHRTLRPAVREIYAGCAGLSVAHTEAHDGFYVITLRPT